MSDWPDELSDSELLACAVGEHPAFRSGAELDRIDPAALSGGEQIALLGVLEEQRRWFEAAQLRVLAVIQDQDDSRLGLGQEGVSLALQLPLRTAQARLAQAATLVRQLPGTLAAVADGSISGAHAHVLAEAVWRLPADDPFAAGRFGGRRAAWRARRGMCDRAAATPAGPPRRARPGPGDRRAAPPARAGRAAGGVPAR